MCVFFFFFFFGGGGGLKLSHYLKCKASQIQSLARDIIHCYMTPIESLL